VLKSLSPVSHMFESRDCTVTCKLNFNFFSFLLLQPPYRLRHDHDTMTMTRQGWGSRRTKTRRSRRSRRLRDKVEGLGVQGAPAKFPFFLKKRLTTLTGTTLFPQHDEEGTCPSLLRCCCSQRGGHRCFLISFWTWQGGGMPLLIALLPFHDGEVWWWGGLVPSPSCFVSFLMRREGGHAPSRRVVAISTRRGGHQPSPLCSHFFFDVTRRGMLLLPFQHDGEGWCPPRCVLLSFLMWWGGAHPSSSRCCHFNTTGRAPALSVVFSFHFWHDEEGKPLLVLLLILTRGGGYCPSLPCSLIFTIKVI